MNNPTGGTDNRSLNTSDTFSVFDDKKYLNLETYRGNGTGVRTPVWFAAGAKDFSGTSAPKLYVYSTADAGKVKRVRRNGFVMIAPCDVRGKVTGPWINALAELATGTEFEHGMRLLDRKYFPWKQLLNLSANLFRRHERVVLSIQPAPGDSTSGR